MNEFLKRAMELQEETVANRRHIHSNPEVGCDLPQTAAFVEEKLRALGLEPHNICKGGLYADIGSGEKTFLLRADMDALPMSESNDLPFCSRKNMAHTCGHDMHTAMLLTAAKILREREASLKGRVRLMFQPAEEIMAGAHAMVEAGVLEGVDAAMAIHVASGRTPTGAFSYQSGPSHASSDVFRIELSGLGCHGAMPHNGIDPINAAVHLFLNIQSIVSRENSAEDPLVITIGSFQAGDGSNIIPEKAVLKGTIRAVSREARALAKKRLEEMTELTAKTFRCDGKLIFEAGAPANCSDPQLTQELVGYLKDFAPDLTPGRRVMASEDFSYVSEKVPATFLSLAAGGSDPIYSRAGQHNPLVVFNEDCLPYGAAAHAWCAFRWLEEHSR